MSHFRFSILRLRSPRQARGLSLSKAGQVLDFRLGNPGLVVIILSTLIGATAAVSRPLFAASAPTKIVVTYGG